MMWSGYEGRVQLTCIIQDCLAERHSQKIKFNFQIIFTKNKIYFCVLKILANRHFLRFFQFPL
jgi:hypothetical protein